MPTAASADATEAGLQRLDQQAWAVQYRDFERAAAIGQQLVEASDDAPWRSRARPD